MPRTSAVNMKCPRSEHAGSRVKLDGTYGKPGHRRQRYTCLPGGGGKPHVFTELLPREKSWHSSCEHCERQLERREGPKAPRHYQFVARGIAEALQAVGAGSTYMRASRVTRDRARRFRCDTDTGELRESSHGQLLADWVEVFAPVVFQPFRPTAWPTQGSLLLDHLPFRVRALDPSGRRIPAGKVAFDVFCGVGFVAGKPKLWLTEAFTSANPANWSAFLGSLPGYPERALVGPSSWHRFVRAAKAAENESLDRWIAVNQGTIETQFARRALTPHPALDMPLTAAALDQITRPISAALYPRRYALKNRERLNRLLMLLQLHINGGDDVQAYARAIRLHLEANGARPLAHRRALTDPLNSPSLRRWPNEMRGPVTASDGWCLKCGPGWLPG